MAQHPHLNRAIRALIDDLASRLPEFGHIRSSQILVVAGEARRTSHATIRPMHWPHTAGPLSRSGRRMKPRIRIRGRSILYVITLRPLWFRRSTPDERVESLVHELFHISTRFDGTLHAGRRHRKMGSRFYRKLQPLVRRYLDETSAAILTPFAFDGLVRVQRWVERPPGSLRLRTQRARHARRLYTEEQLFVGLERMLPADAPHDADGESGTDPDHAER